MWVICELVDGADIVDHQFSHRLSSHGIHLLSGIPFLTFNLSKTLFVRASWSLSFVWLPRKFGKADSFWTLCFVFSFSRRRTSLTNQHDLEISGVIRVKEENYRALKMSFLGYFLTSSQQPNNGTLMPILEISLTVCAQ